MRTESGALRVIYVTEDTGVGGGHRDIFEHLNRLLERGHDVRLFSLGGQPDWFPLKAAGRHVRGLRGAGARRWPQEDAIKVATWWNTAAAGLAGSVLRGVPVFFVQDIETCYYPEDERMRHHVLAGYRHEFRYMTISGWNRDRLRELGVDAELDRRRGSTSRRSGRCAEAQRRDDMVLALGPQQPAEEPAADPRAPGRRCPSRAPS